MGSSKTNFKIAERTGFDHCQTIIIANDNILVIMIIVAFMDIKK
jgi:hypothetical protein